MPTTRGPHDEVIEDKGVKLLIDPTAVMFLLGTEMDYQSDRMRSGFVFNNPNQTRACGCGESVSLKPAAGAPGSSSSVPTLSDRLPSARSLVPASRFATGRGPERCEAGRARPRRA